MSPIIQSRYLMEKSKKNLPPKVPRTNKYIEQGLNIQVYKSYPHSYISTMNIRNLKLKNTIYNGIKINHEICSGSAPIFKT